MKGNQADSIRLVSGHSKWSQIKRQKGVADVKRGATFTRVTREVMLAAKEGGGDPDANFRLRLAMDKARAVNMPQGNIQRAIDRATGAIAGEAIEYVLYEGYGPGGVSILVEAATDNRNRTASEVRAAFSKHNGSLGGPGSVGWQFDQKGAIEIDAEDGDTDEISLLAIDAGAEDVEVDGSAVTVYTTPGDLKKVKEALDAAKLKVESAEHTMKPQNTVKLSGDGAMKVIRLVEALEELDDVSKVHANFDVPEEILANA